MNITEGECRLFTFKEGALSALGHDLVLRAARWSVDLRREVHKMIADGKSDEEMKSFMLERYGDFVLYKPRMTAKTAILWGGPVLMLLLGVFAAVRFIRKRAEEADIATETDQAGPEAGQS